MCVLGHQSCTLICFRHFCFSCQSENFQGPIQCSFDRKNSEQWSDLWQWCRKRSRIRLTTMARHQPTVGLVYHGLKAVFRKPVWKWFLPFILVMLVHQLTPHCQLSAQYVVCTHDIFIRNALILINTNKLIIIFRCKLITNNLPILNSCIIFL